MLKTNASLRSIVRRDTGQSNESFIEDLAKDSGIETPTHADFARLDRKRPKKGSNENWENPHDPESDITKMESRGTHMAHKLEQSVDLSGIGAVLSVTLHGGAKGDTKSLPETLDKAQEYLEELECFQTPDEMIHEDAGREVVGDKGYHSNDILVALYKAGYRTYVSRNRSAAGGDGSTKRKNEKRRMQTAGVYAIREESDYYENGVNFWNVPLHIIWT